MENFQSLKQEHCDLILLPLHHKLKAHSGPLMGLLAFIGPIFILFILLYVWLNDRRLLRLPEEAVALSPRRWTPECVRDAAAQLEKSPKIAINEHLPPKTGRRYIVVGGVR